MNIDDLAIKSANTQGGGLVPSSTGLTPDALPEVQKTVLTLLNPQRPDATVPDRFSFPHRLKYPYQKMFPVSSKIPDNS